MKEWLKFFGLKNFILKKVAFIIPEELYIHEQSQVLEGRTSSTVWKLCHMKEPLIVLSKESIVLSKSGCSLKQ